MAEKDIKRHYRKLSLKLSVLSPPVHHSPLMCNYSHPDKLQLADNQTKEEADAHFVELTKAYKSLVL